MTMYYAYILCMCVYVCKIQNIGPYRINYMGRTTTKPPVYNSTDVSRIH